MPSHEPCKVLMFANTDWYLYNFRLPLAKALRELGTEVVMVSPQGEYAPRMISEGFRWLAVPMARRSLNPLREWTALAELVRIYRRERPDIVHHFTLKCVVYGAIAARIAKVCRVVNAVAGLGYVFTNQGLRARLIKPLLTPVLRAALQGCGSRLIVQNPDDGVQFVQHKLVSSHFVRLIRGSGVDTERFKPATVARSLTPVRVLLATRLLWDKGVGEYVEAATRLKKQNIDVEFLLAGTSDLGNPSAIPVSQVETWGREKLIEVLGHVEDMRGLLATVDLVVLPSYREGVPRILLEAAACGLPIVTTDVPGCREIVKHRINGLLVPARDSVSLLTAIQQLVCDAKMRRAMGDAGRTLVLREFSEKQVIGNTIAVYGELLASWPLRTFDSKLPAPPTKLMLDSGYSQSSEPGVG